jgi:UDP-GlcNAc:undecaprenyl-phosphate GlcNAc-1-phosphate transferase
MSWYFIIAFLITLFVIELIYFKIATYFQIIDKPNNRSSHFNPTIRGGGVVFTIALLICYVYSEWSYPCFISGLVVISLVSFIDDIKPVNNPIRLLVHFAAAALAFIQVDLFTLPVYWVLLALLFVIGTINAVNFMDGINGITGLYGLVALGTLYYINLSLHFTQNIFLVFAILAVIIFNYFNFRSKAVCFAGDVGSISLAFIIVFFLLQLIIFTQNLSYILLLLIYGLDTFTTIVFRLIRRENIFEAHRSHFYQYWVNERQVSHLIVAASYGLAQLIINIAFLNFNFSLSSLTVVVLVFIITFAVIRFCTEGKKRLLKV